MSEERDNSADRYLDVLRRQLDPAGRAALERVEEAAFREGAATRPQPQRRERKPRAVAPNGLMTMGEAAARLGFSVKTLQGHIASGALRYVVVGHGSKRPRKMFTDADIQDFIANQSRKDIPCLSTASRARRTGISTSRCEVIAFTAQPRPQRAVKPKG
jgi:hypothetical protein